MTLLKKTVVLTSDSPCGYVAVIRVGNETGIKIAGEQLIKGMQAVIKIGNKAQILKINGKITESDSTVQLEQNDEIGAVIMDNRQIVCKGGKTLVDKEIFAFFSQEIVQTASNKEGEETEILGEIEGSEIVSNEEQAAVLDEKIEENEQVLEEDIEQIDVMEGEREDNLVENEESIDSEENKTQDKVESSEENTAEENIESDEETLKGDMLQRLSKKRCNYYNEISGQIDELFVVHPREKNLENLIPDSDWIKVSYDKDGYYVIGRLYGDGKVIYLGYGVPGVENVSPPKVAQGIANWIPMKGLDNYEGYWLFFQNADTGKIT